MSKYKVGLDVKDLDEGVDYILTIRDSNVLDDGKDDLIELENALLKKKPQKDVNKHLTYQNDEDPFKKEDILPQYSEAKEESFMIDDSNTGEELNKIKERLKSLKDSGKSKLVEMGGTKSFVNEYMSQEDFKKIEFKKFKKAKNTRRIVDEDIETVEKVSKVAIGTTNYNEYDELDQAIETQRNIVIEAKRKNQEQMLKEIMDSKKKQEEENPKGKSYSIMLEKEYINESLEFLKNIPTKQEIEENYKIM
jgi:hypothetical protein